MEKPMCGCKHEDCKMHRERPCSMISRLEAYTTPEPNPPTPTPVCVPCGAHAATKGEKLRARPGQPLGR